MLHIYFAQQAHNNNMQCKIAVHNIIVSPFLLVPPFWVQYFSSFAFLTAIYAT